MSKDKLKDLVDDLLKYPAKIIIDILKEKIDQENIDTFEKIERLFSCNVYVKELMTQRGNAEYIRLDYNKDRIKEMLTKISTSQILVVENTLDDVIGTIGVAELSELLFDGVINPKSIKKIVKQTLFISPNMCILDAIREMHHSMDEIAVVVDEFGGMDGIISIRDAVMYILGFRKDSDIKKTAVIKQPDGSYIIDAITSINECEKIIQKKLTSDVNIDVETVGGLITMHAGMVPSVGAIIEVNDMQFEILQADPRRIITLKMTKI